MPRAAANAGAPPPHRWARRHFHGVGYVLAALLLGSNMPTPLYGAYRAEFGFSPVVQTLVFATYAAALIPALMVFGPLSDSVGRRPVLAAALAFGALGAGLLAAADSTPWLFAGRIAQGIAVGACSAAGSAALIEHEPDGDARRAALAATATTASGGALGPFFAGVLAQYLHHSLVLPYLVYLLTLVPGAVALAMLPDRRPARPEPVHTDGRAAARPRPWSYLRAPRVPRAVRGVFWMSAVAAGTAWGVVGLFQAVVPAWISGRLGGGNLVVGAAVAALVMLCSVAVQLSAGRLRMEFAQRLGVVLLLLGMGGLPLAGRVQALWLLFATTAVVGFGHGLAFTSSLQKLSRAVSRSSPDVQGGVLAAFFTVTYTGLGLPAVAAGVLVTRQGVLPAIDEFSLGAGIVCVLILLATVRVRRSRAAEPADTRVVASGDPREPLPRREDAPPPAQ